MEQRDYIMRQIDQLGQVLARMLSRLLNIKEVPNASLSLDQIQKIYSDDLDLTLELVLETPKENIIDILDSRIQFLGHHMEKMAEILTETANLYTGSEQAEIARDLLEKSLTILEHLQDNTGEYSMERVIKITELKNRLN